MILRIAAAVFDEPSPEQSRSLLELVFHNQSGSQAPILRALPEQEELDGQGPFWRWLDGLGNRRVDVLELFERGGLEESMLPVAEPTVRAGVWRRARAIDATVEARAVSDWPALRLTVADALDLVKEPVHFRLEDELNDMDFVGWLAPATMRVDLYALVRGAGRVQVHGGGTGGIKRWLDGLERKQELGSDEQRRLWRTWVLFDKDAGKRDAREPSESTKDLMASCERVIAKHGIPFTWVCLQRREIESYVPDDGLRRTGAQGSREAAKLIEAWRAHPNRQAFAWAYDMKKGLRGDLLPEVSSRRRAELESQQGAVPGGEELKEPFCQLPKDERRTLHNGFGEAVLNKSLRKEPPSSWLLQLGNEYDRGPSDQPPRQALVQSIFDRI